MTHSVLFHERQHLGEIILNRPEAYNALSHDMILAITKQLHAWAQANSIQAVLIHTANEKAFCAGGDIKEIYKKGKTNLASAIQFFADEYTLNALIAHYPKPYIALLNGLTMGGGVGISVYASHRVSTERYLFAMPETGIGFFPDVGGSFFLSRCKENAGIYLGLTGARLQAADAFALHLTDYVVQADTVSLIKQQLFSLPYYTHENIHAALLPFHHTPPHHNLPLATIERCFGEPTMEAVLARLLSEKSAWATATHQTLQTKSPLSLKVTLAQLQRGPSLDLTACLAMERGLTQHFLQGHDFYEGIRAAVLDKDQQPQWQPPTLKAVSAAQVAAYFI